MDTLTYHACCLGKFCNISLNPTIFLTSGLATINWKLLLALLKWSLSVACKCPICYAMHQAVKVRGGVDSYYVCALQLDDSSVPVFIVLTTHGNAGRL